MPKLDMGKKEIYFAIMDTQSEKRPLANTLTKFSMDITIMDIGTKVRMCDLFAALHQKAVGIHDRCEMLGQYQNVQHKENAFTSFYFTNKDTKK